MKNLSVTLCTVLFFSIAAYSQDSNMSVFSDLVGQWKGQAQTRNQNGQMLIDQTENIQYELNGKILVIKGSGRMPGTDSLVFQAYGVIHYDKQAEGYKFSAYTMEGEYVLADARMEENSLIWEFPVPNGGKVEYTLQFDAEKWIEDGKYSADGQQWFPFFHMELNKVKN